MKVAVLVTASFLLSACLGGGGTTGGEIDSVPGDDGGGPVPGGTSRYIERGPRLASSNLSPIREAEDDFGADVTAALVRAAQATPRGSSQSSRVDGDGRTTDEMTARVGRDDDGNVVYHVTDRGPVPGPARQGFHLALFTTMLPGIEPDLTSYQHDVLGLWAWNGEVGAFWDKSPSGPPTTFASPSPTGTATYEGDAVGLHAAGGAVTKFVADVTLNADFANHMVSGEVDMLRSIAGASLGDLSVTLGATSFSSQGDAFSGDTTATAVPGSGKWGSALEPR